MGTSKWWLPITLGVGAAAVVTAFQIMTKPIIEPEIIKNENSVQTLSVDEETEPTSCDDATDFTFEEITDKSDSSQMDESLDVNNTLNAKACTLLDESYCEVSSSEHIENRWSALRWFIN